MGALLRGSLQGRCTGQIGVPEERGITPSLEKALSIIKGEQPLSTPFKRRNTIKIVNVH